MTVEQISKPAGWQLQAAFEALGVVALLVLFFVVTGRLLNAPVGEYDEGIVLSFSDFWTRGEIPNRDFFSNYAPGNYWIVGSAFKAFGASVDVEREVGALYRLLLMCGVYALCRRRGWLIATFSSAIAFLVSTKEGSGAYAWIGATALCVASVAVLSFVRRRSENRSTIWLTAIAGLLAGWTALLRADMPGVAVFVAGTILIWQATRREKIAYFIAWLAGVAPLIVHAFRVGVGRFLNNIYTETILRIGPARRLPIPPPDVYSLKVFAAILLSTALILAAAMFGISRIKKKQPDWIFVAIAALTICFLPHAFARADVPHFMYVGLLAFTFAPLAVAEIFHAFVRATQSLLVQAGSCAAILIAICVAAPCVIPGAQRAGDPFVHQVTAIPNPPGVAVNRDRFVPTYNGEYGQLINYLLHVIDDLTKPGDRIYIGVDDLRIASMNDVYLYFLFPKLQHASYFVQVDAGCTNIAGSSLPADLATADILVLNTKYNDMVDVGGPGSNEANEVVAAKFRLETSVGPFRIYLRRRE